MTCVCPAYAAERIEFLVPLWQRQPGAATLSVSDRYRLVLGSPDLADGETDADVSWLPASDADAEAGTGGDADVLPGYVLAARFFGAVLPAHMRRIRALRTVAQVVVAPVMPVMPVMPDNTAAQAAGGPGLLPPGGAGTVPGGVVDAAHAAALAVGVITAGGMLPDDELSATAAPVSTIGQLLASTSLSSGATSGAAPESTPQTG